MTDYNAFLVTLTLLVFSKILKIRYAQSFWWQPLLASPCSLKSRDPLLITGHGRLVRATPENPLCVWIGLVWTDDLCCICSLYIFRLNCSFLHVASMSIIAIVCKKCLSGRSFIFLFFNDFFYCKKNVRKTVIF